MKRWIIIAVAALLIPSLAAAQKPVLEIGTHAGLSILNSSSNGGGQTETLIGLPGAGIPGTGFLSSATIYLTFFPSERLFVEPELGFNRFSEDEESITTFGLAAWLLYAPRGAEVNTFFVGAGGTLQTVSDDVDTDSETAAGVRLGYRVVVRNALAVRFEAGYRRWFDMELNEFSFRVGIGALLSN